MRFWDTSAVIPLIVNEPGSAAMLRLLQRDESMAVWWGTRVECWSAIERVRRAGQLSNADNDAALRRMKPLQEAWNEIDPSDEVRRQAARLLRTHPLRAAEALQLAAAVVWAGRYDDREFVSLDQRLRTAARQEGLNILPLK